MTCIHAAFSSFVAFHSAKGWLPNYCIMLQYFRWGDAMRNYYINHRHLLPSSLVRNHCRSFSFLVQFVLPSANPACCSSIYKLAVTGALNYCSTVSLSLRSSLHIARLALISSFISTPSVFEGSQTPSVSDDNCWVLHKLLLIVRVEQK